MDNELFDFNAPTINPTKELVASEMEYSWLEGQFANIASAWQQSAGQTAKDAFRIKQETGHLGMDMSWEESQAEEGRGGLFAQIIRERQPEKDIHDLTKEEWEKSDDYREGIKYDTVDRMTNVAAKMLAERWDDEQDRQRIIENSNLGVVGKFSGQMVGTMLDPTNLATSFVPVLGEARYAQLVGKVGKAGALAIRGAGEGALGAALTIPAEKILSEDLGTEYTWEQAGYNVLAGIALGSAFSTGLGKLGDTVNYFKKSGNIPEAAAADLELKVKTKEIVSEMHGLGELSTNEELDVISSVFGDIMEDRDVGGGISNRIEYAKLSKIENDPGYFDAARERISELEANIQKNQKHFEVLENATNKKLEKLAELESQLKKDKPALDAINEKIPFYDGTFDNELKVIFGDVNTIKHESKSFVNIAEDIIENTKLKKSKERVKKHGEVFTPIQLVRKMMAEAEHFDWANPTKTTFEPAAGEGPFALYMIAKKLDSGMNVVDALDKTFSIELLKDNVDIQKSKIKELINFDKYPPQQKVLLNNIIDNNYMVGDILEKGWEDKYLSGDTVLEKIKKSLISKKGEAYKSLQTKLNDTLEYELNKAKLLEDKANLIKAESERLTKLKDELILETKQAEDAARATETKLNSAAEEAKTKGFKKYNEEIEALKSEIDDAEAKAQLDEEQKNNDIIDDITDCFF